jgi:hypothetical protein
MERMVMFNGKLTKKPTGQEATILVAARILQDETQTIAERMELALAALLAERRRINKRLGR